MRLAVFSGQYFWFDGRQYSTDEAFVNFVTSFHPYFEKIVFCDALSRERKAKAYVLDPRKVEVCPLPHFNIYCFWKNILVIFPRVFRVIKDNVHRWDLVWIHAPHPIGLIIAYICRKLHKPFFLFIRQNLRSYLGYRNRGIRRMLAVSVATILEYIFQALARNNLTFTVGEEIFQAYKKRGRWVYQTAVSLVTEKDLADTHCKRMSHGSSKIKLLSVGRLDMEKGLIYLIQATEELVARGNADVVLQLAGKGKEEKTLRSQVNRCGLEQCVRFLGYVTHEQLLDLYRDSDIFVISSLTEGCPQTLFEAMACGVPVVATRVGGIPYLITDGQNGLLVKPGSAREIGEAIERLIRDSELRKRLTQNGLSTVKSHTLEAEMHRITYRIQEFFGQSPLRW